MKHAKLSASSSARWLFCPGSVKASEPFENTSSAAASEGTCAHELAEICLTNDASPYDYIGKTLHDAPDVQVDKEMARYVEEYVNYVNSFSGDKFIEERVDFSPWVPEGFGTSDAIVIDQDNRTMHVIDLKYGKGVEVSADSNTQGLLYALGSLNDFGFMYDIDDIVIHIYQPRMGNISEWGISVPDLMDWAQGTVAPTAVLCMTDNAPKAAGEKQCQWCPAKATCETLQKHVEETIGADFDNLELPSVEDGINFQNIMDNKKLIEGFLKAVEGHIFQKLSDGEDIPGYKLVVGRSVRAWSDKDEAEALLRKKRYKVGEIFKQTLISPTQAEKLMSKKYEDVEHLVIKPEGKPTLAKASDKRPALKVNVTDEFDEL
tara:strand:+ start:5039 stop:6166 length:1128 start_codon:yes stop_codon:yes gene_type:complete